MARLKNKPNIQLASHEACTGCAACVNVCPKGCISMKEDREGFLQPHIDADTCIKCHKCEKTCPIITPIKTVGEVQTKTYAGQLKNKAELLEVSSGGAFWALAQTIIERGGVVYGAAQYDVDNVQHIRVSTIEEAKALRRSKYLPSNIDGIYKKVAVDLKAGILVLFSGVGCQIAGLKAYLKTDYENLLTCDVVCHGIPSLKVWKGYRDEKERQEGKRIVDLVFRNKSKGWLTNQYKMTYDDDSVEYCPSVTHPFHYGYLIGLYSRRSCAACHFATYERISDITLADYWRYNDGKFNAKNGVSLICTHSMKGEQLVQEAESFMEYEPTSKESAIASCRHLTHIPLGHPKRRAFFAMFEKSGFHKAAQTYASEKKNIFIRGMKKIYRLIKKVSNYTYTRISKKDKQLIQQYYSDLNRRTIIAESTFEIWKILLCRHKSLITPNAIVRKLARIFKVKEVVNSDNITTTAQQYAAIKEALVLLHQKRVPVFFYHRVGKEEGYTYSASGLNRIARGLSFPKMYEDIDQYMMEFRELVGTDVKKEYVENLGKITQIIHKGEYLCHEDIAGPCVNVVGGKRITKYQPVNSSRTIHVYGRCGAFGYAVEDRDTLPSQLQWFLNQAGYKDIKVVNHGLWGGEDKNIDHNFLLDMLGMKEGDIVIFYRHYLDEPIMQQYELRGMWYKDITLEWHQYPEAAWCFYDKPGHMNAVGYRNTAEIICRDLISHKFACRPIDGEVDASAKAVYINYYLKVHARNEAFDSEIAQYVNGIKAQYPIEEQIQCGGIVMNCNPFTFGHRYLIETAAKQVDRLYVFVVEEDKSFFKFEDRYQMVKDGVADLKNVVVVPSGRFMISAFTFPEYFMKDYVKEKNFDMSSDVEIFGGKIAPALQIVKRFAGEEPFDVVTKNYNDTMKELLPKFGLEFVEIPRHSTSDGTIINATLVRELLQKKDFGEIGKYVPKSTLKILKEHYSTI